MEVYVTRTKDHKTEESRTDDLNFYNHVNTASTGIMGQKSRLSHNKYYYKKKSSQDLTVSVPLQKLTNPIGK